ncbi:MAG: tripartite tricarboxylate transporter substrate binding protein [Alphaproteobacteria bacterium]|nr:tripartite tricarboxylate transporter substrate binding protein [Alphaproteobacteria bacterium]
MERLRRAALIGLSVAGIATGAWAQDYPSRPLTFVVPFTPGAATDFLARLLGKELEDRLGKAVVVENRPGAGTNIGSNSVAKAAPDGYTLLMATSTPMAINVTLHKSLPFDPTTDFAPVAMVAQSPFVLIVKPSLPVKTVQEFIAYAKERPGQLSFGSGGPGAPHHLFAELFASMTGTKMTHVTYRGSVPALNDVVAGHIDFMFCDFASAVGMLQGEKVRPLGVTTAARIPAFPNLPPISEAGVPGYDVAAWFMVATTGKSPPAAVDRLYRELKTILAKPEITEQIAKQSLLPMDSKTVPQMEAFVKAEIVRWGKVVEQAGIAGSQ